MTGLEEFAPPAGSPSQSQRRPRERRPGGGDEDDAEYRLALEASKHQEEEDRARREGRGGGGGGGGPEDDDDLAKAIKLSKEEEERRRRELEDSNATSLFDNDLVQTSQPSQPQYTGFNQGYQQGNPVDFFANPIEQNQVQSQPTGYMGNAYTGFQQQAQPTGYQPNYTGFGMQNNAGMDPYNQQQNMQSFDPQPTGYNPYAQQQIQSSPSPAPGPGLQPGSNNPWATQGNQMQQQSMKPMATGSNNPFAQFNMPASAKPTLSSLGSLPEQKTLSSFNQPQQPPPQTQIGFGQSQPSFNQPQRELSEHESKLNTLLATGDGMDTYGNTGEVRIPSQHTAPGTFLNSAGTGMRPLNADTTGNPFMRQQFTGMPNMTYGSQVPSASAPGMPGSTNNNPFGAQHPQQQSQGNDLIQF